MSEVVSAAAKSSRARARRVAPLLASGLGSLALVSVASQGLYAPELANAAQEQARVAATPRDGALSPLTARATEAVQGLRQETTDVTLNDLVNLPAKPVAPGATMPAAQPARPARLAGRIGPMGRISGPLSTDVPLGIVTGPEWTRAPLPGVHSRLVKVPVPAPVTPAVPRRPNASSELPDERTLALSRLANPALQVRTGPQAAKPEVSVDKPMGVRLSLNRPAAGYEAGSTVAVRVSASAPCYAVLIRVDANGRATTVLRSSRLARGFTVALKAGPSAGPEYLVALASAVPIGGAEAAAILRASGQGFAAVPAVDGGASPGNAWSTAVGHVSGLGGSGRQPQRFEWAVDTASFGTRAPKTAVAQRPEPKSAAPREAARPKEQPAAKAPGEESALPTSKPVEPAKEPPAEPGAKPEGSKGGAEQEETE
jgi:hypothetical protein